MVEFPTIFQIAHAKYSSIADNKRGNSWDIHLRKAVQDWELGSLLEILARIEEGEENLPHTMRWGDKNIFTVKRVLQAA